MFPPLRHPLLLGTFHMSSGYDADPEHPVD